MTIEAWHFVNEARTLHDGNTVAAGYVYSVPANSIVLCGWGLRVWQNHSVTCFVRRVPIREAL